MILDVYPSSKDAKMVDLLYEFERDTRLSLNIIVENYLEKLLYDEGYLGKELKEEIPIEFETKYYAKNRSIIVRGDLKFGSHMNNHIDEVIAKLKQFPVSELEKISANNWDKINGSYSRFLKYKLDNPEVLLEDYLSFSRFTIADRGSKKGFQIRTVSDNFSICSVKNKQEFEKIKGYLYSLSDIELNELKIELGNSTNRRKHILKKIGG